MDLSGLDIGIIGGGIAGLATALALSARGARRITVLEQAPEIAEVGAGLQITPNGMAVLRALGLEAGLGRAPRARAVALCDATGVEVTRLDLTALPAHQTYRFVHRADLIAVLLEAARAAGVTVETGARVLRVVPGAEPGVVFLNGPARRFDLVVGADGLGSVLRPALNGTAEARFTGQVAWRATVPNSIDHPAEARIHMGPGRHIVSYPLRDGSVVNLVAVEERREWAAEGWNHIDDPANLRAAFAGYSGPVAELIEAVEAPRLWGLFRHPVAERWFGPGAVLAGDAAHPTLPFLAQGANLALEDAWVLADALARTESAAAGLALYVARRRSRVEKVLRAADGNAWKFHLRNPLLRRGAHLVLNLGGRLAPGAMVRQFDWLYGHDVTRADA